MSVNEYASPVASVCLPSPSDQLTRLIRRDTTPSPPRRNLTRRPTSVSMQSNHTPTSPRTRNSPRIIRRHIQRRIPHKEIPRPQQHSHWLRRHDGKVFRCREMRQSKGMPQDDVFIVDFRGRVGCDPFGDAAGGFPGGLGHVAACGVELGVRV